MVKEKCLIFGAKELGVIVSILVSTIPIMMKLGLYRETSYMVILVFILSVVFLYCNYKLFILEIVKLVKRLKEKSKKSIKELGEKITERKQYFFCEKDISYQLVKEEIPIVNIHQDNNQIVQHPKIEIIKKQVGLTKKQQRALDYIKVKFGNYIVETEDIELLCQEIIAYSNGKTDFSNSKSIKVKDLVNNDLYHFGWNMWNHFRVGNQKIIANFLQNIFAEKLGNQTIETIISHLRDDNQKGMIIILEDISDFSLE